MFFGNIFTYGDFAPPQPALSRRFLVAITIRVGLLTWGYWFISPAVLGQAVASDSPLAKPSPAAVKIPLVFCHAHNDYENMRPLDDALDHGFCSV